MVPHRHMGLAQLHPHSWERLDSWDLGSLCFRAASVSLSVPGSGARLPLPLRTHGENVC